MEAQVGHCRLSEGWGVVPQGKACLYTFAYHLFDWHISRDRLIFYCITEGQSLETACRCGWAFVAFMFVGAHFFFEFINVSSPISGVSYGRTNIEKKCKQCCTFIWILGEISMT